MIAIIARLILFLAPLVGVVLWVRHRMKRAGEETATAEDLSKDQRVLLRRLAAMVALTGLAAVLLNVFDTAKDSAGKVFIPPHTVDGKVVPGYFVDANSPEAQALKKAPPRDADKRSDDGDGQNN